MTVAVVVLVVVDAAMVVVAGPIGNLAEQKDWASLYNET